MDLYRPVHLSFQRFCRARTNSTNDAKDLISETVLKAYEGIHRLRDENAFLSFLFGIASRIIKNQYRRKKAWGIFDCDKMDEIQDQAPTPEQDLDARFLYEAIFKLPLKYQDAIVLHYVSGFSLQEVADIQESTLSAVKVRVLRGKLMLKQMLKIVPSKRRINSVSKITPLKL